MKLNEYDYLMLGILNGSEKGHTWGAWWTPCLEYLSGLGLCTKGINYQITDKGKAELSSRGENK